MNACCTGYGDFKALLDITESLFSTIHIGWTYSYFLDATLAMLRFIGLLTAGAGMNGATTPQMR